MSLASLLRQLIKRSMKFDKPIRHDELTVAGDQLTLRRACRPPISLSARDVVAISYDYNPLGWMHANSLRLVYILRSERKFIEVYDEQHTKELMLAWLQQHFHPLVASRYQQLWGSPGGDKPSVQLWVADGALAAHDHMRSLPPGDFS